MPKTIFHTLYAPLRRYLPSSLSRLLRTGATAVLTPLHFTRHTGHWRSSLRSMAVSATGEPLPWYTYPCIDFLSPRRSRVRSVLEFGAGQSTLWWARDGAQVVAFEADREWYEYLRPKLPDNVDLRLTTMQSAEHCLRDVRVQLEECRQSEFDAVVIDGLYRTELLDVATACRAPGGIVICDDAEGYDVYERLQASGLLRVDFFGFAPGVIMPRCTSVYFAETCSLFDARIPIASARP